MLSIIFVISPVIEKIKYSINLPAKLLLISSNQTRYSRPFVKTSTTYIILLINHTLECMQTFIAHKIICLLLLQILYTHSKSNTRNNSRANIYILITCNQISFYKGQMLMICSVSNCPILHISLFTFIQWLLLFITYLRRYKWNMQGFSVNTLFLTSSNEIVWSNLLTKHTKRDYTSNKIGEEKTESLQGN